MLDMNDLIAVKKNAEEQLLMAKAKISVIDELISIESMKVETVCEKEDKFTEENAETEQNVQEGFADETY